ncbi:DUF6442 family protein [Carnobacterium gallinarum]|uniref:DUF6442 family protein n=1 Tax=Carnobacterium gallinarum TaxID=2749 RepID=UPI000558A0ED|nr:DUF6442 family protein [Carnobacterium gallinarum]
MRKDQILAQAKNEKIDEGKKYSFYFSIASVGVYFYVVLVILLIIRFLKKENPFDILGILVSSIGVYQYKSYKKSSEKVHIYVMSIFITIGVVLFSRYL